ncbi:hypothetical protein FOZ62_010575, partial [Perkinsus olseni]
YGYRGERRRIAELDKPREDSSETGLVSLECSDSWGSDSNHSPRSVTIEGSPSHHHDHQDNHVQEEEGAEEAVDEAPPSLPSDIITSIKSFVFEEFSEPEEENSEERLSTIAEVGQVLLEDASKYANKETMLAELGDLTSIIGGEEAVERFVDHLLELRKGILAEGRATTTTPRSAVVRADASPKADMSPTATAGSRRVTLLPRAST